MQFNAKYRSSGFVLEVRSENANASDFADTFVNVREMKNGKGYTMSSLDLVSPPSTVCLEEDLFFNRLAPRKRQTAE